MPKLIDIRKPCYAMASREGNAAEITMYGDVVEKRPVDWWTDKPIEGNFIIGDEFLKDLEEIKGCTSLTIRINSYGGDAVVGMMIHNRLRELARDGMALTCIVDAVAMSAASVIMAACDTVRINPTGLVMIHRAATLFWGWYNADELQESHDALVSYDEALAAAYERKTGLSQQEILGMMAETTYMTGREAVERGFADELIEDAEPLNLAASADGTVIFAGGRKIHLAPGMFAPDFIPTVDKADPEDLSVEANKSPADPGNHKEVHPMTLEQLRAENPELVQEITDAATNAERERLRAIDEIAGCFAPGLIEDAKYNDPCSAADLAYRAAKAQAKEGTAFLNALVEDNEASKANGVPAATGDVVDVDPNSPEAMKAAGKQAALAFVQGEKKQ